MHGGKRENAGRKRKAPTKRYSLPIALEAKIAALVAEHNGYTDKEKPNLITGKKSKAPVIPMFPMLSKEQKRRLRIWLTFHGFEDNMTNARKATETPKLTKETVLKYCAPAEEKYNWSIGDILELYAVD